MNAGYTLLAQLKADSVAAAHALLGELAADSKRLPFCDCATIHFATLTIIPAQSYRHHLLPATVMLATSFSGPSKVHVAELVRVLGAPLREVFACCEGFDPACDDDELAKFIRARRHGDTFYSGMQNLSPLDVRRHRELRDAIEDHIDSATLPGEPMAAWRAIQQFVDGREDLRWAREPFEPPRSAFFALHWRTLIVQAVLGALVACSVARIWSDAPALAGIVRYGWSAVVAALVVAGYLLISVREAEAEQRYVSGRQLDADVRVLAATQNRPVINELTIAGPIKEEGPLRPLFLRLSLWVVARLAEGIPWLRSGIDIPTVATARWIAADAGRRLVFISNYTNAAEPYVRDFIDVHDGAIHINLTFGFGRGYPKTAWVVEGGALTDPNAFIYVVTENQRPTAIWYGPYRDMSIDNIKVNRAIREGLYADLEESEVRAWLSLL